MNMHGQSFALGQIHSDIERDTFLRGGGDHLRIVHQLAVRLITPAPA